MPVPAPVMPGYFPPPAFGGEEQGFVPPPMGLMPPPMPRPAATVAQSRALWLGGVGTTVSEADLRAEFAKYGMIDFIKV